MEPLWEELKGMDEKSCAENLAGSTQEALSWCSDYLGRSWVWSAFQDLKVLKLDEELSVTLS